VSEKKAAVMLAPQFNTWGAEVARGREWGKFHQADMDDFYAGMRAAGMKAGMFVIDAKWEGKYGELAHSAAQFPRFEESIAKMRSEGMRIGMWAAFLRCENPADLGLTTDHLLRAPDGKPFSGSDNLVTYYLLDFTQPEVQKALRELARKFMRRYRPDLVKFDFGYEIPALHAAAPKDMRYAGERVLKKGVEVVVGAMREENPDLVVIYYSLSPLFVDYFDMHSPDDLFMCQNEYDLEANRRFFFSSLLGELGMPTYGSGGYDWPTSPSIWFDSAAIGTLGSLVSFSGDEQGARPKPEWTAKFNGVAQALRPTTVFRIEPVDAEYLGPVRGARSSSWARLEDGKLTLVALRAWRLDGRKGSGKYRDAVATTASVVVASKTDDDVVRASKLAVVPFGDGEVRIKREGATKATVREHAFGGGVTESRILFRGGVLPLPLRERTEKGVPVEWIEVRFG
jgi:hypothetical protein